MTLKEIQHIVDIADTFDDLDNPDQMDEYFDNVFMPIKKAVATNDKTTIAFIAQCSKEKMRPLYTGVMDGALEGKHPEAIALYKRLCKELGVDVDARITA